MFIPGRTPWTPLFGAEIGGVRGGAPKKILSVSYCFERSRDTTEPNVCGYWSGAVWSDRCESARAKRARCTRFGHNLDTFWGVDTSVYQGGQYTGNLPPPLFGVDGHKNY